MAGRDSGVVRGLPFTKSCLTLRPMSIGRRYIARLTPEDIVSAARKKLKTAKRFLAQNGAAGRAQRADKEDVKAARQYIKTFWKKLEHQVTRRMMKA